MITARVQQGLCSFYCIHVNCVSTLVYQHNVEVKQSRTNTVHTASGCEWFLTDSVGTIAFLEDLASGLLRSAKGWMVLQDCRY